MFNGRAKCFKCETRDFDFINVASSKVVMFESYRFMAKIRSAHMEIPNPTTVKEVKREEKLKKDPQCLIFESRACAQKRGGG